MALYLSQVGGKSEAEFAAVMITNELLILDCINN